MSSQAVELQARSYVYDLNNCAKENGFKADESWEVLQVSDADKFAIQNRYHPTMVSKFAPEILSEMLNLVKSKITAGRSDKKGDFFVEDKSNLQYLIAYNPNRLRR